MRTISKGLSRTLPGRVKVWSRKMKSLYSGTLHQVCTTLLSPRHNVGLYVMSICLFFCQKNAYWWWRGLTASTNRGMVWYSRVERSTRHIICHFGDDFTGHITQPTVSQHWRTSWPFESDWLASIIQQGDLDNDRQWSRSTCLALKYIKQDSHISRAAADVLTHSNTVLSSTVQGLHHHITIIRTSSEKQTRSETATAQNKHGLTYKTNFSSVNIVTLKRIKVLPYLIQLLGLQLIQT